MLKEKTPTELLKIVNELKKRHDEIKLEIDRLFGVVDDIGLEIEENIKELTEIEEIFVEIINELENREDV
jgi:hypothetical protein